MSWRGTIAQNAGRLHRLYDAKRKVRIYDYADFASFLLAFKAVTEYLRTPEDYELITYRLMERLRAWYEDAGRRAASRRQLVYLGDYISRGPDSAGYHVLDSVALGMRRLSIIDLSTGHQPISNEDGSCWIVFNGEIYNFADLRADFAAPIALGVIARVIGLPASLDDHLRASAAGERRHSEGEAEHPAEK